MYSLSDNLFHSTFFFYCIFIRVWLAYVCACVVHMCTFCVCVCALGVCVVLYSGGGRDVMFVYMMKIVCFQCCMFFLLCVRVCACMW
jgi:hypothetical protein